MRRFYIDWVRNIEIEIGNNDGTNALDPEEDFQGGYYGNHMEKKDRLQHTLRTV